MNCVRQILQKSQKTRYFIIKDCLIRGNDYEELTKTVVGRVEELLRTIDNELKRTKMERIRNFTIGKTFAPNFKKDKNRWRVDGICNRWNSFYAKKGYDFLLAFAIVTKENVPPQTIQPFNYQQNVTLALESQLIQHFCYVKCDDRLDNDTLHPGNINKGYAGQILYLAVRFTRNEDEKDSCSTMDIEDEDPNNEDQYQNNADRDSDRDQNEDLDPNQEQDQDVFELLENEDKESPMETDEEEKHYTQHDRPLQQKQQDELEQNQHHAKPQCKGQHQKQANLNKKEDTNGEQQRLQNVTVRKKRSNDILHKELHTSTEQTAPPLLIDLEDDDNDEILFSKGTPEMKTELLQ